MFIKMVTTLSQRLWHADSVEWGAVVCDRPPSSIGDWRAFVAEAGGEVAGIARTSHVEIGDDAWTDAQKKGRALIVNWALLDPDSEAPLLIVTTHDLFVMNDNGRTIERVR